MQLKKNDLKDLLMKNSRKGLLIKNRIPYFVRKNWNR